MSSSSSSVSSSSVRKFIVASRNDQGGFSKVGLCEYHTKGAGFTSAIKGDTFDVVERAVNYIVATRGCCGVQLENGLKIDELT